MTTLINTRAGKVVSGRADKPPPPEIAEYSNPTRCASEDVRYRIGTYTRAAGWYFWSWNPTVSAAGSISYHAPWLSSWIGKRSRKLIRL